MNHYVRKNTAIIFSMSTKLPSISFTILTEFTSFTDFHQVHQRTSTGNPRQSEEDVRRCLTGNDSCSCFWCTFRCTIVYVCPCSFLVYVCNLFCFLVLGIILDTYIYENIYLKKKAFLAINIHI